MNAMKTGDSENAKSISEAAANVEAMANEIKVN
jgi:hypothetical protein